MKTIKSLLQFKFMKVKDRLLKTIICLEILA